MREFDPSAEGQRSQLRSERERRGEPPLPDAQEWCVVGYRLEVAGFPGGAAEAFRAALRDDGGIPQAHLGLGRALLDLGDADGASEAFRAAVEADRAAADTGHEPLLADPDEDPWYQIGLAEHSRGRLREALDAYRRCADLYPWFPEPLLEIARCHAALGEADRSAAACHDALARAPHRPAFRAEVEAILRKE